MRCREIHDDDIGAIADLQARGFSARGRAYWLRGLQRAQQRTCPDGYARYGHMLECEGRPVGVILTFYAQSSDPSAMSCNVGGWYVEPAFRGHAPRLVWAALKHKDVTYTDVTPAISTYPIVEAFGFRRYCNGLYVSIPALSRRHLHARLEIVSPQTEAIAGLSRDESNLLTTHAGYGCLSVVCRAADRDPDPFILLPFRMRQGKFALPAMQLAYCRDIESYQRCAGLIGRELLRRGKLAVLLNANGSLDNLVGFYTERRGRKYYRGPKAPALADLTNTELVLFGV